MKPSNPHTLLSRLKSRLADQRTYYWVFLVVLLVPNLFLCFTEPLPLLGRVALIVVPGAVWMALLTLSRRPGIPIWCMLPLLVFGAFQLVLLYLFGNSIIAVDMLLNVATTNSGEALELLGKLVPAIGGVIVLYVPTLILGVMSIRIADRLTPEFRRRNRLRAGALFLVGVATIIGARIQDPAYRVKLDIWPANIAYNLQLAVERWDQSEHYAETSRDFRFEATTEHADSVREVYILVVGETSRALNWQLYGYDRETTPRLVRHTDHMVWFRDMLTQANATHKSVPIMMSAASAENFNTLYTQKSILTAFKEAGFQTAFFSNQLPNRSFIDYFGEEADTTVFLKANRMAKGEDYNPYDNVLLESVDPLLADTTLRKLFIVLHTYGSHFNYCERYPADCRVFTPDRISEINRKDRQAMINAYDNSIVATDRFLDQIIERLAQSGKTAAMLYLSDHGEDLLDDDRNRFLHASPVPTYYQLHVPFILWFSPQYAQQFPTEVQQARERHTTPFDSRVVFHTLLAIGGIDTEYRNDTLSLVSPSFHLDKRYYLGERNTPIPIQYLPFDEEDFQAFEHRGITPR